MSSFCRILLIVGLVSARVLGGSEQATADVIFSENFSSLSGTAVLSDSSERASGAYLNSISLPGWNLEGNPAQILGFARSVDEALLLNEGGAPPNAISRTISGLLPGVLHTLRFEYWGDNVTGDYSFFFEINGVVTNVTASHSGQNTGNFYTQVFAFTPATASTLLRIGETATGASSPILDNLSISAAAGIASTIGFEGTSQVDNHPFGTSFIYPPDSMGAAGLAQFVEFNHGSVAVYDKGTGAVQSRIGVQTFWQQAGIPIAGGQYSLGDQRVLFDRATQRWIATGMGGAIDRINIAVSATSDPLGPWTGLQYLGVAPGDLADHPTLGMDGEGVYIATSDFASPDFFPQGSTLSVIPKSDLFGAPPTLANRTAFTLPAANGSPFTIQGAVDWSGTGNRGHFIANDAENLVLLRFYVDGVDGPGATMSAPSPVGGASYGPNYPGRQPDGTRLVQTLNDRPTANVVRVGDRLFVVHTVTPIGSNYTAVRWGVIDATSGLLIDEGDISGGGYDYYQGSIAVNEFGQAVIAYNRSGFQTTDQNSDGKPDGRISFLAQAFETDPQGGLDPVDLPRLLRVSDASDYRCGSHASVDICMQRWGHMSAVSIDPTDHRTFYAIGEYAAPWTVYPGQGSERSVWHTWIAGITLVPEPDVTPTLIVGFATITWLGRRRARSARGLLAASR